MKKSLLAAGMALFTPAFIFAQSEEAIAHREVHGAAAHAVSVPVRDMEVEAPHLREPHEKPRPLPFHAQGLPDNGSDPVAQTQATILVQATNGASFAGIGNLDYGFAPDAAPPDTNGSAGLTQYVQWVNESFAVFNKSTHALVAGPIAGNQLWKNLGGGCATNNDGDPIAQYDKVNNRWILTQFSVSSKPYMQCFAVSQTSDATGAYNLYAFTEPNFNDYPKTAVWADGYYTTYNMFSGNSFVGGRACAYNAAAMRAGTAANEICFQLTSAYGGLLPSDLDWAPNTTLQMPPSGSPEYVVNFGTNSLNVWKFHPNFTTPASSTFTGPTKITVAAFTSACGGGTCIPQPGTSQTLDSLADRLMYRLAYSNISGQESLVVNHSVKVSSSKKTETDGVRWYEIRNLSTTPTVFQQGTFSPDSNSRWMGSIARDKAGNIAMGYSVSSGSVFPSIRYTGRVATDALGTMEAESSVLSGNGSQGRGLNRWGDYSNMSLDPADGCTLWYTTEYLKSNGTFNWSTWINNFKMAGCQ